MAYHEAIMITLDHMIFNNPFSKEIVPLSIGDAPIQIETITLTTWGETEQDAYVPENSIS